MVRTGDQMITNYTVVNAKEDEEAESIVTNVDTNCTRYKMDICPDKTLVIFKEISKLEGQRLKKAKSFTYLGAVISIEGLISKTLSRIAQTTAALFKLKPFLWSRTAALLRLKLSSCGRSSYSP